jgi:hypothetical protein
MSVDIDKILSNEIVPDRSIYFVLQLGEDASYIFDETCRGPFVVTMDLYINSGFDTLETVCETGPYEQLRVYCQDAKNYEFYVVDETKKLFRLLATSEALACWLFSGEESRLYAQPRSGFELTPERIELLLPEWEHKPFWALEESVDRVDTSDTSDTSDSSNKSANDDNE